MAATSRIEKKAVKVKHRAEQLDGHMVKRWKRALDFNAECPKGVKAAMHEIRLRGSGSAPDLSAEQEQQIDTAWHYYAFPTKKRKKKVAEGAPTIGISTTSAPTKRRRLAAVSDVDTDMEEEEGKDDRNKENEDEPIMLAAPTARDVLREERYQILQGEVTESGSNRVLKSG